MEKYRKGVASFDKRGQIIERIKVEIRPIEVEKRGTIPYLRT